MIEIKVRWNLIPDGISTIVQVHAELEFTVESAHAQKQAENGVIEFIHRISPDLDLAKIREAMEGSFWSGEGMDRPDEPKV